MTQKIRQISFAIVAALALGCTRGQAFGQAERFEVTSIKAVRPTLVNTIAALQAGDLSSAQAAFAALQFEAGAGAKKGKNENGHGNGNGHHREVERRTSARRMVAVPIRVRLEHVPWFEETMTIDASNQGLRFVSSRQYEPGQHLIVSFEDAVLSPWPVAAEFRSLVVRVDPLPQGPALAVTIYRVS